MSKFVKDALGNRMKKYYEEVPKSRLIRRMPVIIRLDGKAFHTLLRGFDKPFDDLFIKTMSESALDLCANVQNCVLGYVQSDEISLLLVDYETFETSAWFDYEIQKMCSVSASILTDAFSKNLMRNVKEQIALSDTEFLNWILYSKKSKKLTGTYSSYMRALTSGAKFDSRVFNIPKEEVVNYFYWRQLDASRNSVQMVGQSQFSASQLHKKSNSEIQEMLFTEKGINWNNFETHKKRGRCIIKCKENGKSFWKIDNNIPIFKGANRDYIGELVWVGD